jgi:hypothetical protein
MLDVVYEPSIAKNIPKEGEPDSGFYLSVIIGKMFISDMGKRGTESGELPIFWQSAIIWALAGRGFDAQLLHFSLQGGALKT